jgi:hypothetical protein
MAFFAAKNFLETRKRIPCFQEEKPRTTFTTDLQQKRITIKKLRTKMNLI